MKRMNGRDVCRSSVKRSGNVLSRSVANWTRAMSLASACNSPITEDTVADFPVPRAPQRPTSCAPWPYARPEERRPGSSPPPPSRPPTTPPQHTTPPPHNPHHHPPPPHPPPPT